ncbi:MAG: NAD-dependent epimerase/dehydratase family protein [Actinomycetales bacterium]|nr:NAD-dependent epimerase/dehydratase family protein [Actinomycetales bacterium]
MTTVGWVIGARGMLGKALTSELERRPEWKLIEATPLPWGSPAELLASAEEHYSRLLKLATETDSSWTIFWVAGSGTIVTSSADLEQQIQDFNTVLSVLAQPASAQPGSLFFASSAGGVYGGSENPPFTEETPPKPISPYGETKLRMESIVVASAAKIGISSLIGRISNLYGPGQKLDKMQGLISQLALAQLTPRPAHIVVPLETVRDYIYVEDCARAICDACAELLRPQPAGKIRQVTKIIASGEGTSIASLLSNIRLVTKKRPNIIVGTSQLTSRNALDLRLKSVVWPHLDSTEYRHLDSGIKSTLTDVLTSIQEKNPPR